MSTLDARQATTIAKGVAWLGLLAMLLCGSLRTVGGYDTAESDFYAAYAPQALRLWEGEAYTWGRSGPGYSCCLWISAALGIDLFLFAKLLAAIAVTTIAYASFVIGRTLLWPAAALGAQLAVLIALFRYGTQAGNDALCAAFSTASLALLVSAQPQARLAWIAAGLLAGAAAVTRYPALALLAACVPALLFWHLPQERWRLRIQTAALFSFGFLLSSGPWWVWNSIRNGSPLASKAYALVALEAYGEPGTKLSQAHLAQMETRFASLSEVLGHDPLRFLAQLPLDFYQDAGNFLIDTLTLPFALLLAVGVVALLTAPSSRPRPWWTLAAFAALAFSLVALAPYQSRYHMSLVPIGFLVACAALFPNPQVEPQPTRVAQLRRIWLCASYLFLIGSSGLLTWKVLRDSPADLRALAEPLRERGNKTDQIVVRKPQLAFLAGLEPRFLTETMSAERFVSWIQSDPRTRFVYLGPRELECVPQWRPLVQAGSAPEGYSIVARSSDPPAIVLERN